MLTKMEITFGKELTVEELNLIGEFLDNNITDDWMLVSKNIEDTE
jgi:hypothetical protein